MTSESGEYGAGVPIGSWYGAPLQAKSRGVLAESDLVSTTIVFPTFLSLPLLGVDSAESATLGLGI
jgi:hypothetical protein